MAPSGRGSVKYGSPLFCARWAYASSGAAPAAPAAPEKKADEAAPQQEKQVEETVATQVLSASSSSSKPSGTGAVAIIGGGGGGGKHGIPNRLMCVEYRDGALAEEASATTSTADESPQLLALHPDGTTLVCATSSRCRAFDVRIHSDTVDNKDKDPSKWLAERTSAASTSASLAALSTIGTIRSLAFAPKGDRLAAGTEEGRLYVVKWPSMALVLDKQKAHAAAVTDVDLNADGSLMASTSSDKQCVVWSLPDGSMKALLNDEKGEYRGCRFAPNGASLFVVLNEGKRASIVQWDTLAWKPLRRVVAHKDRITAFTSSRSGRFLASGTVEGDVAVVDARSLSVVMRVKRAHSFFVTSVDISPDDRLLLSASVDASARATVIKRPTLSTNMVKVLIALLVVLLAWILQQRSQSTSRA
eukprot:jgi/Chlat1/7406/Chrsp6S07484